MSQLLEVGLVFCHKSRVAFQAAEAWVAHCGWSVGCCCRFFLRVGPSGQFLFSNNPYSRLQKVEVLVAEVLGCFQSWWELS